MVHIHLDKVKKKIDLDVLIGNEGLFYFSKWQASQTKDLLYLTKRNLILIKSIHLFETCSNRDLIRNIPTRFGLL